MGGFDEMFFMWMISKKFKYEESKEATLIDDIHLTHFVAIYTYFYVNLGG